MAGQRQARMAAASIRATALSAVVAVVVCLALLATRFSSPEELLYTGHVDMMHGANWASNRLPDDAREHIGAALKAIDTSDAMAELDAAHFGSTRLPGDSDALPKPSKTSMLHLTGTKPHSQFLVSRELAGELADGGNNAAALRTSSFKWAMDDCKAQNNCQSLVGKRLWRVLQTKAGKPNLHIFHDQDDDRRHEERNMEKDYLHARKEGSEQSAMRWAKLKQMMTSHKRLQGIPEQLQAELHQIEIENIPNSEKKILEKSLLRNNEEERQATRDTSEYQSDTSLIYGGGRRGLSRKWREYKASMVPSKRDQRDEVQEARSDMSKHISESNVLHKMETKATSSLSSKADKAGQHEVKGWAATEASLLQHEDDSHAIAHAHKTETRSQKDVRRATEHHEVSEMQHELQRYARPFDKATSLRAQLKQYRQKMDARKASHDKAQRRSSKLLRRAEEERSEQLKEKRMAADELSSYDTAYSRRPIISPPGSTASSALSSSPDDHGDADRAGRTEELSGVSAPAAQKRGGRCYLASGKEVPCQKLSQLGHLMKEIYGNQAQDVAIVSKDHSFDPTQVLKAPPADFPAAPTHSLKQSQHASHHTNEHSQEHTPKKVEGKNGGQSRMGLLIHKMNEEEVAPIKRGPTQPGALAGLSHSLAAVIGW